jgi:hypothetical protein
MPLRTERLGATEQEPLSLEVASQLAPASTLLWHLSQLPGLRVIAKKSWALTDDFEAYFLYKGRLFVMETPFVNVWVSLVGQPTDEQLFSEVESQVQQFSAWAYFLAPLAIVRYFFTPFNPPLKLLQQHSANKTTQPS